MDIDIMAYWLVSGAEIIIKRPLIIGLMTVEFDYDEEQCFFVANISFLDDRQYRACMQLHELLDEIQQYENDQVVAMQGINGPIGA